MDSENIFFTKRLSESIWIWFFQMDSDFVFNREGPSESIWIWIFQMDSDFVFNREGPSESIWIWIFQMDSDMYSLPKGCLNPSESDFFRWIQKMYSLLSIHPKLCESNLFQNDWEKVHLTIKVHLMEYATRILKWIQKNTFSLLEPSKKIIKSSRDHIFVARSFEFHVISKYTDWFK